MVDGLVEHLSRLHVMAGGDGAKKRGGRGKAGASQRARCRVENDCERDRQQASSTKNHHLALSDYLPQQPRISSLNHCAQHEARQVCSSLGHRSSTRNSIVSQHS
jgi:hypothetical protein